MSSFTDQKVSDTYSSILHVTGASLISNEKIDVYDGVGNRSALSLGTYNSGADIAGPLACDNITVGELSYPNTPGTEGQILIQGADGIEFSSSINSSSLEDLSPDPSGTYNDGPITSIKINSKGLVTELKADAKSPTPELDLNTNSSQSNTTITGLKVDKFGYVDKVYTTDDKTICGFTKFRAGGDATVIIPPRATEETSGWIPLTLPKTSSSFPDSGYYKIADRVKGVSFNLKPDADIVHDGKLIHIEVTDDPTATTIDEETGVASPVVYTAIYHKMPSSVGPYRVLGSVSVPIARLPSGDGIIYIRNKTVGFPSSIQFSLEKLRTHF